MKVPESIRGSTVRHQEVEQIFHKLEPLQWTPEPSCWDLQLGTLVILLGPSDICPSESRAE